MASRNTSDILIADEWVAAGIPKEDIVLGFQPTICAAAYGLCGGVR